MQEIEQIVIGAGVVGLALARALALEGREVLLIEKNKTFGEETSSRNSEVIHAGMYYEPESLKAKLCVRGKHLLYTYLKERRLPFKRCEKLIVAANADEVAGLQGIKSIGLKNGVRDLKLLNKREAQRLEPNLKCEAALFSPSTGIFDSHAYMLSLLGDFENVGGITVFKSPVLAGRVEGDGVVLEVGGDEPTLIKAKHVYNCAGLYAPSLAKKIEGVPHSIVPEITFAKGRYFTLTGKAPFHRLIYPMPSNDSLGTHYTRDLAGQGKLGPDIQWNRPLGDYFVEAEAAAEFARAAQSFYPDLNVDDLSPAYAGLRPKIGPEGVRADFKILGPQDHGVKGITHLFGIESPGLTSSLAIAEWIVERT